MNAPNPTKKQSPPTKAPQAPQASESEDIPVAAASTAILPSRKVRPCLHPTLATRIASSNDYIDARIRHFFSHPGLSEQRFLRLSEYNFLRAFVQNAQILALPADMMKDDDALSPWSIWNPYPAVAPCDLKPTETQLCFPHHPYLDVIASVGLRNNVLLAGMSEEVEERFCCSMHQGGFVVWGEQPWSAMCEFLASRPGIEGCMSADDV